jgi:transcription-repair coupling factor (superfamily II helicase)
VLAVPDAARAYTIAGLAQLSDRHPIVVAMPTSTDAERLASDLRAFLGPDEVDLFPAWETLPFERVSPGVEAMGRRLRTMWRLQDPARMPRVLVAPVRSLVQRLGPHVEEVEPVVVTRGDQVDPIDLVERLVVAGYRRERQVESPGARWPAGNPSSSPRKRVAAAVRAPATGSPRPKSRRSPRLLTLRQAVDKRLTEISR